MDHSTANHLISLMSSVITELEHLRRENEHLRARCSTLDIIATALGMRTGGGVMTQDLIPELRKQMEDLMRQKYNTPEPAAPAAPPIEEAFADLPRPRRDRNPRAQSPEPGA